MEVIPLCFLFPHSAHLRCRHVLLPHSRGSPHTLWTQPHWVAFWVACSSKAGPLLFSLSDCCLFTSQYIIQVELFDHLFNCTLSVQAPSWEKGLSIDSRYLRGSWLGLRAWPPQVGHPPLSSHPVTDNRSWRGCMATDARFLLPQLRNPVYWTGVYFCPLILHNWHYGHSLNTERWMSLPWVPSLVGKTDPRRDTFQCNVWIWQVLQVLPWGQTKGAALKWGWG